MKILKAIHNELLLTLTRTKILFNSFLLAVFNVSRSFHLIHIVISIEFNKEREQEINCNEN